MAKAEDIIEQIRSLNKRLQTLKSEGSSEDVKKTEDEIIALSKQLDVPDLVDATPQIDVLKSQLKTLNDLFNQLTASGKDTSTILSWIKNVTAHITSLEAKELDGSQTIRQYTASRKINILDMTLDQLKKLFEDHILTYFAISDTVVIFRKDDKYIIRCYRNIPIGTLFRTKYKEIKYDEAVQSYEFVVNKLSFADNLEIFHYHKKGTSHLLQ